MADNTTNMDQDTDSIKKRAKEQCTSCTYRRSTTRPRRGKAGQLLKVLGVIALLEGALCLLAAYLDQVCGILPTDPLSILGFASLMAGVLFMAAGMATCPGCSGQVVDDMVSATETTDNRTLEDSWHQVAADDPTDSSKKEQ